MSAEIMETNNNNQQYPIRTVSEVTGVNAVTLRAWERRYGLIQPLRTPKGHRLYTQDDISLINDIQRRLADGTAISKIARDISSTSSDDTDSPADVWVHYRQRMVSAVEAFNESGLDTIYNDAMSLYPVDIVTLRLILPLLDDLGERWKTQPGRIAEEHFFSVYLRNKLGARFHHQNLRNNGPTLIAACLPGEHHEFGLLLFALMANSKGFRIILLGADLPVYELHHVVSKTQCQGVVLSGSATLDCSNIVADIELLTRELTIPVFVGGDISELCTQKLTAANVFALETGLANSVSTVAKQLQKNANPNL
jgi:DNA-binding transcriptional MerR regulator/methylmalonyl-CoA mutase cobalamin-binding subunit